MKKGLVFVFFLNLAGSRLVGCKTTDHRNFNETHKSQVYEILNLLEIKVNDATKLNTHRVTEYVKYILKRYYPESRARKF